MEVKIEFRSKQAWVMVRTYLESVFGGFTYRFGTSNSDDTFVATLKFNTELDAKVVNEFIHNFLLDSFELQ